MQRWITGGNASGLASTHDDPLLGVPQPGRPRIFRCLVGDRVVRLDLGDAPLVSLQWGLYAFAPSPAALRAIDRIVASPPLPTETRAAPRRRRSASRASAGAGCSKTATAATRPGRR